MTVARTFFPKKGTVDAIYVGIKMAILWYWELSYMSTELEAVWVLRERLWGY